MTFAEEDDVFDKIKDYYDELQFLIDRTKQSIKFKEDERDGVLKNFEGKIDELKKKKAKPGSLITEDSIRYLELMLQAKEVYYRDYLFRIQRKFEMTREHIEGQIEHYKLKLKLLQEKNKRKLGIQDE